MQYTKLEGPHIYGVRISLKLCLYYFNLLFTYHTLLLLLCSLIMNFASQLLFMVRVSCGYDEMLMIVTPQPLNGILIEELNPKPFNKYC